MSVKYLLFNIIQGNHEKIIVIYDHHMSLAGISLAGDCNDHQPVTMADRKPMLLLQICDMKLMKYINGGMVL